MFKAQPLPFAQPAQRTGLNGYMAHMQLLSFESHL